MRLVESRKLVESSFGIYIPISKRTMLITGNRFFYWIAIQILIEVFCIMDKRTNIKIDYGLHLIKNLITKGQLLH